MNNYIQLTPVAQQVIEALRHSAGTHEVYRNTLTLIFNQVLHAAEDLGMDELEALETLRALDMIRRDLAALATTPVHRDESEDVVSNCFRQLKNARYAVFEVMGRIEEMDENPELRATTNAIERAAVVLGKFRQQSASNSEESDPDGLHIISDEEFASSHTIEEGADKKQAGG